MLKLYDSAFSPFARKVRMVLEHKGLEFEAIDGLLKSNHAALKAVNGRIEVPVLVDGDVVVVNSADIVAYLEFRYPANPVYPEAPAARVHARAWERAADTFIDGILINISYWKWADRQDTMPAGLLAAARADFRQVYSALDRELAHREFVSGPSVHCRSSRFCRIWRAQRRWRSSSPPRSMRMSRAGSGICGRCQFVQATCGAPGTTSPIWGKEMSRGGASSGAAIASSGCWPAASTIGSSRRSRTSGCCGRDRRCRRR